MNYSRKTRANNGLHWTRRDGCVSIPAVTGRAGQAGIGLFRIWHDTFYHHRRTATRCGVW